MRPNIILIVLDAMRADYWKKSDCYKKHFSNNNLAYNLPNYYSTGSWTQAAMPAILSGTYPVEALTVNDGREGLPIILPTLPGILKETGYYTAQTIGKGYGQVCGLFGYTRDFDYFINEKKPFYSRKNQNVRHPLTFKRYLLKKAKQKARFIITVGRFIQESTGLSKKRLERCIERDQEMVDRFSSLIRNSLLKSKEPFFLYFQPCPTHYPYATPLNREEIHRFLRGAVHSQFYTYFAVTRSLTSLHRIYEEAVKFASDLVDKVIDDIGSHLNRPTVLIVTSDHGEALGERRIVGHPPHALIPEILNAPCSFLTFDDEGHLIKGIRSLFVKSDGVYSSIDLPKLIFALAGIDEKEIPLHYNITLPSIALSQGLDSTEFYISCTMEQDGSAITYSYSVPLVGYDSLSDLYNKLPEGFPRRAKNYLIGRWTYISRYKTSLKLQEIRSGYFAAAKPMEND